MSELPDPVQHAMRVGEVEPERDGPAIRHLAMVGVAGPLLFATGVVVAGAMTPGYSHLSEPVSQLAAFGQPYPAIQMAGFVVFGLGMVATGVALWQTLRTGTAARVGEILLIVAGVNMILTGLFRADPMEQETLSVSGTVHVVTASVVFLSLIAGFLVMSRAFRKSQRWAALASFSFVAGLAAFVFLAAYSFAFEAQPDWIGLWQRLLAATLATWFVVVTRRLLRLASPVSG